MPEKMGLQDFLYVIEAVVLGGVIAFGYLRRKRSRNKKIVPSKFAFENSAPFELAYAVNAEISATPSTEIAAGLFIFFTETQSARIAYRQLQSETDAEGTHRYSLSLIQHDVAGVEWLSLERRLDLSPGEGPQNARWRISAKANIPTTIKAVQFVPRGNGVIERLELGARDIGTNLEELRFTAPGGYEAGHSGEDSQTFRFVILFEVKAGLQVDMLAWDIDVGEAQDQVKDN